MVFVVALRDEFSYKPKITKEQFFAKGFAERKCLLVMDIIRLCRNLHADLARQNKGSSIKKRTPLSSLQSSQNQVLKVGLASSTSKHYSTHDYDIIPQTVTSYSENDIDHIPPPSRYISEAFWRQSISGMVPPMPVQKPKLVQEHDPINDSLLYYQPSGNQSINDDVLSISDAGKPMAAMLPSDIEDGDSRNFDRYSTQRTPSPYFQESANDPLSIKSLYSSLPPPSPQKHRASSPLSNRSRSQSPTKSVSFSLENSQPLSFKEPDPEKEHHQFKEPILVEKFSSPKRTHPPASPSRSISIPNSQLIMV